MSKYVFVGADAEGYRSGAYACEGVFVTEAYYEKYKTELEDSFSNRYFHELDGKHSEVEGDLVVRGFANVLEAVAYMSENDVSYETYHLTEYIDDYDEDFVDVITKHVEESYSELTDISSKYKSYSYVLTPEQNEQVEAFIEELKTKGSR